MKDEGKEKTRGVAVLGVLRPDGFSYFSKYFAKMSRFIIFYLHEVVIPSYNLYKD